MPSTKNRSKRKIKNVQNEARDAAVQFGLGQTLAHISEDPLLSALGAPIDGQADKRRRLSLDTSEKHKQDDVHEEWQTVSYGKDSKKQKNSNVPETGSTRTTYPSVTHSSSARLHNHVKLGDIQQLILYILGYGQAPQWISVRNHKAIKKVVVLMVPGLERGMFDSTLDLENLTIADAKHLQSSDPENRSKHRLSAKSPDDYYPVDLSTLPLPSCLLPFGAMFEHIWPVKAPGDERNARIFSPMGALLQSLKPIRQDRQPERNRRRQKQQPHSADELIPITQLVVPLDQLQEEGYVIHPSLFSTKEERRYDMEQRRDNKTSPDDGWLDTSAAALENNNAPVKALAIDCEMCETSPPGTLELTRISIVDYSTRKVVLDELVKPEKPITNYLTAFSGIDAASLEGVTTTLQDIQQRLVNDFITPTTILIGHSLNSDLSALKMTHPHVVDTALIYPHPRGPPLKSSLKFLAQKYLNREIQRDTGSVKGHDPRQDALAALDLVREKCKRGHAFGTIEANLESIFLRLARSTRPGHQHSQPDAPHCTGAVVDWGFPARGFGSMAEVCVNCTNDADVVNGVMAVTNGAEQAPEDVLANFDESTRAKIPHSGVDFVFARMRQLEAQRGWWNRSTSADNQQLLDKAQQLRARTTSDAHGTTVPANANSNGTTAVSTDINMVNTSDLKDALAETTKKIQDIHDSLPPCTLFIVASGTGNPLPMQELHGQRAKFREEFKTKKWDQLSVQWTDDEQQALGRAVSEARMGIGFICIK